MDGLMEDSGDGSMICTEHPFKNNTPAGGICAFCLQDKLGKLVSSSFPIAVFPSSSSSSPSFRSDINITTTTTTTTTTIGVIPPRLTNSNSTSLLGANNNNSNNTQINHNDCHYQDHHRHHQYHSNRSRILYLLGQKKKKKKDVNILSDGVHVTDRNNNIMFKRSKSTAAAPRRGGNLHYMDANDEGGLTNTPHKRGFWSFLYSNTTSSSSSFNRKTIRDISSKSMRAPVTSSFPNINNNNNNNNNNIIVEENGSPCHATYDRKVSRSRSVGCGSRSFSGDFFERISTGLGDCTLRRVESQREGKVKLSTMRNNNNNNNGQDGIQERVRCGGLFSGFMITSSSSSSSSSSNWVGSNTNEGNVTGKVTSAVAGTGQHSRSKSWGWALASPMRAFSRPASTKKKNNRTPNLNAIPSLLSVGS